MRESVSLRWTVDEAGYDIVESGPSEIDPAPYLLVEPRGGNTRNYDVFRDEPALFRTFADTPKTTDGLLEFANEYGVLGNYGQLDFADWKMEQGYDEATGTHWGSGSGLVRSGERVESWFKAIDHMNALLDADRANDVSDMVTRLHPLILATLLPTPLSSDTPVRKPGRRGGLFKLALQVLPTSLLSGMALQFALHVTESMGELRQCQQCKKWIYVGPGTGFRSDTSYCSQRCSDHARYLRRKSRQTETKE